MLDRDGEPALDKDGNKKVFDKHFRVTLDRAEVFDFENRSLITAPGGGALAGPLAKGARVEALYRRKQLFLPGTITAVHANGTVDLDFDGHPGKDGALEVLGPQTGMSEKGYYSASTMGAADKVPQRGGVLAVARAFGDFFLKQNDRLGAYEQAVTAEPEVTVYLRGPRDAFVCLASDGVYEKMSDQQVVDFLGARLGYTVMGPPRVVSAADVAAACDALVSHCLAELHATDNVSCVVVILGDAQEPGAPADSQMSQTPTKTPCQPVLTPSSGTANATPVHETMSRVSDPSEQADKAPLTADVKRHLDFDDKE